MFSERIKQLRKQCKETQQEMADKLNVSQRTVANWEAGERMPAYGLLLKIADLYMVSTDYLLGRIDEPMHKYKRSGEERPRDMPPFTDGKEALAPDRRREPGVRTGKKGARGAAVPAKDFPKNCQELEQFILDVISKAYGETADD